MSVKITENNLKFFIGHKMAKAYSSSYKHALVGATLTVLVQEYSSIERLLSVDQLCLSKYKIKIYI